MEPISNPRERVTRWADIATLTAGLEGLHVREDTLEALAVDPKIYPRLPPVGEILERLEERLLYKRTQDQRHAIRTKCLQLQNHVLSGYASIVSRVPSMQRTLGIADSETQSQYREALEKWYRRAEQEILDAYVANEAKRPATPPEVPNTSQNSGTILRQAFDINPSPNDKERALLAEAIGSTYKQVTTWFQNRRQRYKAQAEKLAANPDRPIRALKKGQTKAASTQNHSQDDDVIHEQPTSEKIDGAELRHSTESETRANSLLFPEARTALSSDTSRCSTSQSRHGNVLPAGAFGTVSPSDMHVTAQLHDDTTAEFITREPTVSQHEIIYPLDAPTTLLRMQDPPSVRPLPNLNPTPTAKRPVRGLPKSKKGAGKPNRPIAKPAYVQPESELEALTRSESEGAPSTGSIPARQLDCLPPAQILPPTPPSDLYSDPSPTSSRIPSLTRSVSTVSESTDGSLTDLSSDGPYDEHHRQVSGFSDQGSVYGQYGAQGGAGLPTSFERGGAYQDDHAFATPMKTAYASAATPMTTQTYGIYSSPLDQTPTQRNFQAITHALPQIPQIQSTQLSYHQPDSASHQPLPPCRTMLPPNATTPQSSNIFQLMTDQSGAQFLVPVQSMVPAQYVQIPALQVPEQPYQAQSMQVPPQVPQVPIQQAEAPYNHHQLPPQAQPQGIWEAQTERDLRVVSYQTQLPPQPTPTHLPYVYQPTPTHSAYSTPASTRRSSSISEEEITPSPYQTPVRKNARSKGVSAGLYTTTPMDLTPKQGTLAGWKAQDLVGDVGQKKGVKNSGWKDGLAGKVLQGQAPAVAAELPELYSPVPLHLKEVHPNDPKPSVQTLQAPSQPLARPQSTSLPLPEHLPIPHPLARTQPPAGVNLTEFSFSFPDLDPSAFGQGLDDETLREMRGLLGLPEPGSGSGSGSGSGLGGEAGGLSASSSGGSTPVETTVPAGGGVPDIQLNADSARIPTSLLPETAGDSTSSDGSSTTDPAFTPTQSYPQDFATPFLPTLPQTSTSGSTTTSPFTIIDAEIDPNSGFRYEWEWGLLPFDSMSMGTEAEQGFEL